MHDHSQDTTDGVPAFPPDESLVFWAQDANKMLALVHQHDPQLAAEVRKRGHPVLFWLCWTDEDLHAQVESEMDCEMGCDEGLPVMETTSPEYQALYDYLFENAGDYFSEDYCNEKVNEAIRESVWRALDQWKTEQKEKQEKGNVTDVETSQA